MSDDVNVIMLHGFGSSGTRSTMVSRVREIIDRTVLAPSYPYHNAKRTAKYLRDFVKEVKDNFNPETLTYMGLSLGGFWADYLSRIDRNDNNLILLNPALNPTKQLKTYSHITGMTMSACEKFNQYSNIKRKSKTSKLVLVAEDDDIINNHDLDERFSNHDKLITTSGGHQLINTLEQYSIDIQNFLE